MASAELSRGVERVIGYPPLSEMGDQQRREFHEALLDADRFEDLPGKWQAAILEAEQNRPNLRAVASSTRSALAGGWLLQLTARPRLLQRRVRRTVV